MIWLIIVVLFFWFLGTIDQNDRAKMAKEQEGYIYDKDGNLKEGQQYYCDKVTK